MPNCEINGSRCNRGTTTGNKLDTKALLCSDGNSLLVSGRSEICVVKKVWKRLLHQGMEPPDETLLLFLSPNAPILYVE
jgi:hypothetical protein